MNFLLAEVTENKIAYNEFTDPDTQITYPRGVIRFTIIQSSVGLNRNDYAVPLFPTETNIPKIGENILLLKLPSAQSNEFFKTNVYYYFNNTLAIRERLLDNVFVGMHARTSGTKPLLELGISTEVPEDVVDEKDTPKFQPYEGDRIYQSRYGSNIRLGSNNYKDTDKNYQITKPPWEGSKQFSPILTITNGIGQKNSYTIEDPDRDRSLIYLTSDQKIRITSSQSNIGIGSTAIKAFSQSQVIISSDRLFFNSRLDNIILSAKKDVNIATPNWAVKMDTFFTVVEDMKKELDALHKEVNNLTLQFQTLSTGVQAFGIAQSAVAASLVVLSPLSPAPAAAGATATTVLGSTGPILTNLTRIKSKLIGIGQTITTLKQ